MADRRRSWMPHWRRSQISDRAAVHTVRRYQLMCHLRQKRTTPGDSAGFHRAATTSPHRGRQRRRLACHDESNQNGAFHD